MPPETTKERRVDAGAILELAAEVRALAMAVEHDRQDRRRERDEDRAILKEWREGQERRLSRLEDSLLQPPDGLVHRLSALESAMPDDLSNRIAAADAHRHAMRFWVRTIGGSIVSIMVTAAVGLWVYLVRGK